MDRKALAVIGLFYVMPVLGVAFAMFKLWLDRRDREIGPASLTPALQARFDALEATIESLAVEVERLAEGQRFVSKVLVERGAPPLAVAAAPLSLSADRSSDA